MAKPHWECKSFNFQFLCQYFCPCNPMHVFSLGLGPAVKLRNKFLFLPSILRAGQSLNHPFNKSLFSQPQVSILPFLTSPACCSCDLRALSALHGGKRLHRVESMACWVVSVMLVIFLQQRMIKSACALSRTVTNSSQMLPKHITFQVRALVNIMGMVTNISTFVEINVIWH